MEKRYVSIEIVNKDCKGMFLLCDSTDKKITSTVQANRLISKTYRIELRVKVNGVRGKKVYTINNKTFIKALEYVASKRDGLKQSLKDNGNLKPKIATTSSVEIRTFKIIADEFIINHSTALRPSTIQNYSTALRVHSKPLHDKSIRDIEIEDIQRIINSLKANRADATVVLYARTLFAFLKKHDAEIIHKWSKLVLPSVNNKVEYKLNIEDTKKIIDAMREYSKVKVGSEVFYQYDEVRNIFAFLLTGRRISEVVGLMYSDLNFNTNTFTIPADRTKGKKDLTFNIDEYLHKAIQSQAQTNNININNLPDKRIFSYTGETIRIHFQRLLKAIELPRLRLHDIRHMIASTLVQNKVSINDISVLLGHSSIAVTESRYITTSSNQAKRATDMFNDIVKD